MRRTVELTAAPTVNRIERRAIQSATTGHSDRMSFVDHFLFSAGNHKRDNSFNRSYYFIIDRQTVDEYVPTPFNLPPSPVLNDRLLVLFCLLSTRNFDSDKLTSSFPFIPSSSILLFNVNIFPRGIETRQSSSFLWGAEANQLKNGWTFVTLRITPSWQ